MSFGHGDTEIDTELPRDWPHVHGALNTKPTVRGCADAHVSFEAQGNC